MIKKILNFFDKFEDNVRGHLSHYPILYTFIGATAIVLFWRDVWVTTDMIAAQGGFLGFFFNGPVNLVIVVVILLATGLFVSYFIGDTILISGLKNEKKTTEKTEKEIQADELKIASLEKNVDLMKDEVDEIRSFINIEAKEKWEKEVKRDAE